MIAAIRNVVEHRELIAMLTWKSVAVRYKQAYLAIGWAILSHAHAGGHPRAQLRRNSEREVPYPALAFAALLP